MARAEERAVRKLEQQIARAQQRLTGTEDTKWRRGSLIGGVVLGTVAGGLLTSYLLRRNSADEWEISSADDAILLREQPVPTGQTAEVKPLPKLNVAAPNQGTDEVAATMLESPTAAPEAKPAKAQAEQPKQSFTPAKVEQPTAQSGQTAKAGQPTKAQVEQRQDTLPSGAIERPEIVLAKASGNTDEELAEAASNEPTPATTDMRAEPLDGVCPASHPIKGNRGSMGALIYHIPGGRNYDRTKPEACFASIEDAEAAGYRAPRG